MNTKNTRGKTADTWTKSIEEMLIEAGLKPITANKEGAFIMPAPKNLKTVEVPIRSDEENSQLEDLEK